MTTTPTLAEALVLVFTPGVSLRQWDDTGLLGREWALYERLSAYYSRIVIVTWGDESDLVIAEQLKRNTPQLAIVCRRNDEDSEAFMHAAPGRVSEVLSGSASALVKTNQLEAGDDAIAIVDALRRNSIDAALMARGGFHWSRFVSNALGPGSPEAADAAAREELLCGRADVIVGTSRAMLDDLAWGHRIRTDRFRLVPNYVAMDGADQPLIRDRHRVLYAGRFAEHKRVDLLIRAVAEARRLSSLPITLRLIGSGLSEPSLRELAIRLNVPTEVQPRLPHRALMNEMRTCAVYAQTSAYEGHPKTVLEAMSNAAAVLVADAPGLREVVLHERTGLVTNDDVGSIAASLHRLLRDEALRGQLGNSARRWAFEHVALDRVFELELEAHRHAAKHATRNPSLPVPGVRFTRALLAASPVEAVDAWKNALSGFVKRLPARQGANFLAALDAPLYEMQGTAAIAANSGLHPKHRVLRYHDFFVERISHGERVLDLGCGVGALACAVAGRSGATVVGVDWTPKNLEKARSAAVAAAVEVEWLLGDLTTDRAQGGFDAVIMSNVLEHLVDRPALLRRLRDWYAPSRFLVRVPAFDREWRVPWKKELGVEWRLDPTHETEYTESQLQSELSSAGLRVTELIARWGEYWCVASAA